MPIILIILAVFTVTGFVTVKQGTVAVLTIFGKYRRILTPGLSFRIPLIEKINKRISIQNRSVELGFQAVTQDQANVHFKAMLLYAVINQEEETIKNVAFKFVDETNFTQALIRTIEGTIRSFVATKKQSEILGLRSEIVLEVKLHLDQTLEEWGYHMIDIQLNQRGQGIALFRQEVAKGMANAAKEMADSNVDTSYLLFSMWTEAIKHFAENGNGNVIFLDGSNEGMQKTMQQMMSLMQMDVNNKTKTS